MKESYFTKNNTPPWMFFMYFTLYKWCQIAQSITFEYHLLQSTKYKVFIKYNIYKVQYVKPFVYMQRVSRFKPTLDHLVSK